VLFKRPFADGAGALRQHHETDDDEGGDHRGGEGAAQRQPTVVVRLVEKIADRGAERPGEDECRPEQRDAGDRGAEIERRDDDERRTEDQRAADIAEPAGIGRPVAERGTERLRQR
jgi:hypothetical protein